MNVISVDEYKESGIYTKEQAVKQTVPIYEKVTLTIREAAEYFHIGENRMRRIVEENPYADYIIMNGNRVMIKRKVFEKYIDESSTI